MDSSWAWAEKECAKVMAKKCQNRWIVWQVGKWRTYVSIRYVWRDRECVSTVSTSNTGHTHIRCGNFKQKAHRKDVHTYTLIYFRFRGQFDKLRLLYLVMCIRSLFIRRFFSVSFSLLPSSSRSNSHTLHTSEKAVHLVSLVYHAIAM